MCCGISVADKGTKRLTVVGFGMFESVFFNQDLGKRRRCGADGTRTLCPDLFRLFCNCEETFLDIVKQTFLELN